MCICVYMNTCMHATICKDAYKYGDAFMPFQMHMCLYMYIF